MDFRLRERATHAEDHAFAVYETDPLEHVIDASSGIDMDLLWYLSMAPIKSKSNREKHGIDFESAEALWKDPRRIEFVARFSDEPRLGLVAKLDEKLWTAIFAYRADRTRIISVRRSRENEEELYNDSTGIR